MKAVVKEETALLAFVHRMLATASMSKARKMLKNGLITVDERVVRRGDVVLQPGRVVAVIRGEGPTYARKKVYAPGEIMYEDESLIVVQKPSGLLSISTDREKAETMHAMLFQYMQAKENGRVYLVHRLDRHVAGLMVFAKSSRVKTDLQLGWDDAEKRYTALVVGKPPQSKGRIDTWLEEVSSYKMQVCAQHAEAKRAVTEYEIIEEMDGYTLLDIKLLSGRRHQIRAHLAHIGCPIAGDGVYGTPISGSNDILLFSYMLRFRHPKTGRMVVYKAEVPKNYRKPPGKARAPRPANAAGSGKTRAPRPANAAGSGKTRAPRAGGSATPKARRPKKD